MPAIYISNAKHSHCNSNGRHDSAWFQFNCISCKECKHECPKSIDIPFKVTRFKFHENGSPQVFQRKCIWLTTVLTERHFHHFLHATNLVHYSSTFSLPRERNHIENDNTILQGRPRGNISTTQNIKFLRK